jgi:plasmid stabilization system protein ParE
VKLRYTPSALADLDEVLAYISGRSPQGAKRVHARIKAITDLLLHHSRIGTMTDDPTIRRMTTSPYPYLIFYEPTETEIIVHAVRHGARDPSDAPGSTRPK